jgi:O-antigen/teichoic acid export membrane protein
MAGLLLVSIILRILKPGVLPPVLEVISLAIVPFSLMMLHTEMLRALGAQNSALAIQWILAPALSMVFMKPFHSLWGVPGVAAAYVLSISLCCALSVGLWKRSVGKYPREVPAAEFPSDREIITIARPLMLVASIFLVNGWISTWVLGIFCTPYDIGLFNAAQKLGAFTSIILIAANAAMGPTYATLFRQGNLVQLARTARRTTLAIGLLTVPVVLALTLFSPIFLGLFGRDFLAADAALKLIVLGQLVNVATGPVGNLLVMTGNETAQRNSISAGVVTSVFLNLLLVPNFGIIGAAVAMVCGGIMMQIIATYHVNKRLNMSIGFFKF